MQALSQWPHVSQVVTLVTLPSAQDIRAHRYVQHQARCSQRGCHPLEIASTHLLFHPELDKDSFSSNFGTITTVIEELCLRGAKS